jgi:hypothetical protein
MSVHYFIRTPLSFPIYYPSPSFVYAITLVTYALVAQKRGNRLWNKSVNEATFFGRPDENPGKLADLSGGEVEAGPMTASQHHPVRRHRYLRPRRPVPPHTIDTDSSYSSWRQFPLIIAQVSISDRIYHGQHNTGKRPTLRGNELRTDESESYVHGRPTSSGGRSLYIIHF